MNHSYNNKITYVKQKKKIIKNNIKLKKIMQNNTHLKNKYIERFR